ncbi:unnamed protein product [Hydatigera taeniaeformis]|uniref:Sm domain-containing protein n=1 Tax=Hydatigena taeniaeformis TaxID=6205 RepID=A0A0R3X8Z2_HYDTA|nr:unnamed protein product [Hydatigera taeniaeformis]
MMCVSTAAWSEKVGGKTAQRSCLPCRRGNLTLGSGFTSGGGGALSYLPEQVLYGSNGSRAIDKHKIPVAAEGIKKAEKEQHQTESEEEQQEEGQQQQQQQQLHPSSPSPSSLPPPLAAAAASAEPAAGAAKSPQREGDSRAGKDETEPISAKTVSAPATPSGVPWLAEKAIVLVRFSECFRRGRVIRYDAELNMCVVQLDFTNTVVNKGIEDIFPDDPSIITAATAAETLKREQKTPTATTTRPPGFVSSDVPCPSSAPPFM